MNPYYPKLFTPITIGRTRFRNRIWGAPHMMSHMDFNGRPDDSMIAFFAEKARGGAAVVTLGDTPVDREHAATNPRSFSLSPENMPMLAEIAQAIHAGGARASHELNHGGNMAFAAANPDAPQEGWEAWGPVEVHRVERGVLHGEPYEERIDIHGMTEEDMNTVANHFADAAATLKTCGYDMVLIHGGHGWLLDQFLSPLTNTRTDEYGGSLENRAKFPLMVVERIRQRCGPDFLIEYRMSGSEEIEGGLTKEEGIAFAKLLDGKVDIIHVSAGMDTEEAQAVHTHPTMFLPHGVNVHYAADIKAAGVKTPVLTIGGITTPELAESILEAGKADMIGMTRALIADPHFPEKAKHGHPEDIVPCLRCLDCLTGLHSGCNLQCAVNPSAGRENHFNRYIKPASEPRKVLVVGGGPGGMKAAVEAHKLGHQVTLAEQTGQLGGLLKFTDYDDLKVDLMRLKNHLIAQVEKSGLTVLLNTTVTADFVREGGYEAVIVAAGSTPAKPPIPGLDKAEHATTVYTKLESLGKNVAVLGGGLVGCETGLFLAERGHNVTIVEMQEQIAPEANWMHREGMLQSFAKAPITVRTGLRVSQVGDGAVIALDKEGNSVEIPADSVVYAMGMRPNTQVVEELEDCCVDVIPVGDCVRARKARQAMEEGFNAAVNLH